MVGRSSAHLGLRRLPNRQCPGFRIKLGWMCLNWGAGDPDLLRIRLPVAILVQSSSHLPATPLPLSRRCLGNGHVHGIRVCGSCIRDCGEAFLGGDDPGTCCQVAATTLRAVQRGTEALPRRFGDWLPTDRIGAELGLGAGHAAHPQMHPRQWGGVSF